MTKFSIDRNGIDPAQPRKRFFRVWIDNGVAADGFQSEHQARAWIAAEKAKVVTYYVGVNYRTNSGCNTKTVAVEATSLDEAFTIAFSKVRRQRGVVKIDGGDCRL